MIDVLSADSLVTIPKTVLRRTTIRKCSPYGKPHRKYKGCSHLYEDGQKEVAVMAAM